MQAKISGNRCPKTNNTTVPIALPNIIQLSLLCDQLTNQHLKTIQKAISWHFCTSARKIVRLFINFFLYELRHKRQPRHFHFFVDLTRYCLRTTPAIAAPRMFTLEYVSMDIIAYLGQYLNASEILNMAMVSRTFFMAMSTHMSLPKLVVIKFFPTSIVQTEKITSLTIDPTVLINTFFGKQVKVCFPLLSKLKVQLLSTDATSSTIKLVLCNK